MSGSENLLNRENQLFFGGEKRNSLAERNKNFDDFFGSWYLCEMLHTWASQN